MTTEIRQELREAAKVIDPLLSWPRWRDLPPEALRHLVAASKILCGEDDVSDIESMRRLHDEAVITQLRASVACLIAVINVGRFNGWHTKDHLALYEAAETAERKLIEGWSP